MTTMIAKTATAENTGWFVTMQYSNGNSISYRIVETSTGAMRYCVSAGRETHMDVFADMAQAMTATDSLEQANATLDFYASLRAQCAPGPDAEMLDARLKFYAKCVALALRDMAMIEGTKKSPKRKPDAETTEEEMLQVDAEVDATLAAVEGGAK